MKRILNLIILILLVITTYSQSHTSMNMAVSLSKPMYSFKNYNFDASDLNSKFKYSSEFTPKLGVGLSYNKNKFHQGLYINIYGYSFCSITEMPELFVPQFSDNLSENTPQNLIPADKQFYYSFKYIALSIEYYFSYQLFKDLSLFAKVGFEKSNLENHSIYNVYKYHTISDNSKTQEFELGMLNESSKFIHKALFSFGGIYKISEKFQLVFLVNTKPFGNNLLDLNIKYDEPEIDAFSMKMYNRYINLSLGVQYDMNLYKNE